MNKKLITLIVTIIVIGLAIFGFYTLSTKLKKESANGKSNNNSNNNIAVLYFSVTGNTKSVAKTISKEINAKLIEIEPKQKYVSADLSRTNSKSRAYVEGNDSTARPEIGNQIDISNYDIIYLGYPIWWGDVPKIILTFMDTYNLEGKTVIPFCTSAGTGISQSITTLKNYNKNVNWIEGKRLTTSKKDIKEWLNSLDY